MKRHRRTPLFAGAAVALVVSCAAAPPIDEDYEARAADYANVVELPFVTNRAIDINWRDERYYSNELGGLSAGRCAVGIESDSDGDGSLIGTESSTVLETVASLEPYRDAGIVVYFHGYYEDFERSCRRAATFKRRLTLGDGFLLFSWPANSTPLTYGADVADLEASTPVFLEFLNELGRRHGPENISIIGHSLGTRGLVKALSDWPDSEGRFRNLVLIAADIDRERFVEAVPILKERIEEITVLVSDRDLALRVSETVNDAPRLGQSDGVVVDGVTFFDVTDIANQHLTGHIYHLRNDRVVDIIRRVLSGDVDAG